MNRIYTWVHLCVGTAALAGAIYWLFNAGMLTHHLSAPVSSALVMTFLPGVLVGMMMGGTVHDGFGIGFNATILTAVCSGVVWGTLLFLLPRFVRVVGLILRRA